MKKYLALILSLTLTLSALLTGCGYEYKELNLRGTYDKSLEGTSLTVYNWGEYISDGADGSIDVNKEFEKLTGIKVNTLPSKAMKLCIPSLKAAASATIL